MALSNNQQTDVVFKQIAAGAATTDIAKQFFEEAIVARPTVFSNQVWTQSDEIPAVNPFTTNNAPGSEIDSEYNYVSNSIVGGPAYPSFGSDPNDEIVLKKIQFDLTYIVGTEASFQDAQSVAGDIIPFNFDAGGSYAYYIEYDAAGGTPGTRIFPGEGDWFFNTEKSVLTFFDTANLPVGLVPGTSTLRMTAIKYIGTKGNFATGTGGSGDIISDWRESVSSRINLQPSAFRISNFAGSTVSVPGNLTGVPGGGSIVDMDLLQNGDTIIIYEGTDGGGKTNFQEFTGANVTNVSYSAVTNLTTFDVTGATITIDDTSYLQIISHNGSGLVNDGDRYLVDNNSDYVYTIDFTGSDAPTNTTAPGAGTFTLYDATGTQDRPIESIIRVGDYFILTDVVGTTNNTNGLFQVASLGVLTNPNQIQITSVATGVTIGNYPVSTNSDFTGMTSGNFTFIGGNFINDHDTPYYKDQEIIQWDVATSSWLSTYVGEGLTELTTGSATIVEDESDTIFIYDGINWNGATFGTIQAGDGIEITLGNTINLKYDSTSSASGGANYIRLDGTGNVTTPVLMGDSIDVSPVQSSTFPILEFGVVSGGPRDTQEYIIIDESVSNLTFLQTWFNVTNVEAIFRYVNDGLDGMSIGESNMPTDALTDVLDATNEGFASGIIIYLDSGTLVSTSPTVFGNLELPCQVPVIPLSNYPTKGSYVNVYLNGVHYGMTNGGSDTFVNAKPFHIYRDYTTAGGYADESTIAAPTPYRDWGDNATYTQQANDTLYFNPSKIGFPIETTDTVSVIYSYATAQ